jgi:hypothetical protein
MKTSYANTALCLLAICIMALVPTADAGYEGKKGGKKGYGYGKKGGKKGGDKRGR